MPYVGAVLVGIIIVFAFFGVYLATRYKRCPSDMILVKYGSVGGEHINLEFFLKTA